MKPTYSPLTVILRILAIGILIICAVWLQQKDQQNETLCHGQCATGNSIERHNCKKLCETVCPTYGEQ